MLTQKQEKFVQELIKGKSQREAYKAAYNASRMKDKTIDNVASRLFKKDEIRARYEELKDNALGKTADDAESMRAFIIAQLKKIASGELCETTQEFDGEGNLIKSKRTVKAADVTNAMNKLAEYYGVQTEKDQTVTIVFQEDSYGA